MENSRCVEKWMNQDDIFNSLICFFFYKAQEQEYHTFVSGSISYISEGFKLKIFLNPRKIVKKFALCYPQRNATCAIKTNNLLELSK